MAGTMTWVGLDVHARSTHAAAIDVIAPGKTPRVRATASRLTARTRSFWRVS
jgi:hypothetical protein